MKVKYIGKVSDPLELINGRIYDCLGEEKNCYRVIDETKEDYLYPKKEFEIIISEGKNRQVRKMCEAVNIKLVNLKRIQILTTIRNCLKIPQQQIFLLMYHM